MLDQETKKRIFDARDILVGKIPDPKAQVEQITTALIYKFMADMDYESEELGGEPQFFTGEFKKYAWSNLVDTRLGGEERLNLYVEALEKMPQNPGLPLLFRNMLKNAFLPYRDPETLRLFLKKINEFTYDHSEKLGDAFEYLLSVLGSQGDAGQFRTPRHIIDFIVDVLDPQKGETILDPACGTGGFLISSYKHILRQNMLQLPGDQLTPDEKTKLMSNFIGYDISPDMVRLCLVNMYLHNFQNPITYEYDTLTSEERWDETGDVIMANPPFMSPTGGIRPHKRFSIQAKRSEILFVDYIAEHLNINGRAGIIVPDGIVSQSSTAYKALRKMLVEKYLYAVVSLPAGVFKPYAGVKTNILLMDKRLVKRIETILFIKIENDGFDLGDQRKPIDKNDLPQAAHILKYYRQGLLRGEDVRTISDDILKEASKLVMVEKLVLAKKGDYNLSGDRYREIVVKRHQTWPMVDFEQICTLEYGSALPERERMLGEYPVVGSNGITGWHNKYLVEGPAIIVGRKGSAGEVVWIDKNCFPIDTTYYIKITQKTDINVKFLYYMLNNMNLQELKGGGAIPGLNRNDVYETKKIPLPPITIQKKFVAELDSYQKIIEGAKQVVENYKPTLRIDPSWRIVELGEIIDTITDYHANGGYEILKQHVELKDKEDFALMVRSTDFENDFKNDLKYIDRRAYEFLNKSKLFGGELIINKIGNAGKVYLMPHIKRPCSLAMNQFLIRINEFLGLNQFVYYFLNSPEGQSQIQNRLHGATTKTITKDEVRSIRIPIPPIDIQKQIVLQIEEEQKLVEANNKLIHIFEQKIKDKISEVWGDGDASIEDSHEVENNYIASPEDVKVEIPQIEQAALFPSFE
jgi:type I restriction enzyme M protein